MVLQRFHTLGNEQSIDFYRVDAERGLLTLTPELLALFGDGEVAAKLAGEIQSRWDLLEHAFDNMIKVEPVDADKRLAHVVSMEKRKNLTPLQTVLSGYQRGKCFYCGEDLYDVRVDHVIPYKAILNNHVWNLVLAHEVCNNSKVDHLPSEPFIEKLLIRNEYYIQSAHPLKNTLMLQMGITPLARREFVYKQYNYARGVVRNNYWRHPTYDPSKDVDFRQFVRFLGSRV
jgi:5-methylcytosine-specific restriction endonuclease McrA